jgi:hypothetical protein
MRELREMPPLISPPSSEILGSEHVSLLQWVYVGREEPVPQSFQKKAFFQFSQHEIFNLAKQLILIYTPAISCLSLRYALLVFSGIITSGGLFTNREEDNSRRARRELANRSISAFEEGDVLAAFLLAFSTWVNPDAQPEELGIHLNGFLAIVAHVSRPNSTREDHSSLWYFRTIARDLLLHAAARDLTPDGFHRFVRRCGEVLGTPSFAQRADYLSKDLVKHLHHHISYHEMTLIKGLRLFGMDSENFRPGWLPDMKTDLVNMDHPMHYTLLPYVSMATAQFSSAQLETIELSFATLIKYHICSIYVTIFETSSFAEGLATLAGKKLALDLLFIISQVGEYNRKMKGSVDFILQGSSWLCVRALPLVAMAFPNGTAEPPLYDSE